MTIVQIVISDALANGGAAEGLLEPGAVEALLRERDSRVATAHESS
jgi:hypothetical protein